MAKPSSRSAKKAGERNDRSTMLESRIDLDLRKREGVVRLLNARLADVADLRSQAKQAHWNVKGMEFYAAHLLFDKVAALVDPFVDGFAERATGLGGVARGTVRMAAATSTVPEFPATPGDARLYVEALAERVAHVGGLVREAIDEAEDAQDRGTADLFTDASRQLDQALYFLEAHLQKP